MNEGIQAAVLAYAAAQYGVEPEHLWLKAPDHAVLRRADSRKWFALLGELARGKLGLVGEGCVRMMVVKCEPQLVGVLRRREGILPAYHMDKGHWITVLLDGTVPPQEACALLDRSYALAAVQRRAKR